MPEKLRPNPDKWPFDLDEALGAVFAYHADIPEEAFTASTLGQEREGNAVLIDDKGYLLTIGYLATEADEVTLTDVEGTQFPARVVGYDQVTGLGLLRADGPLDRRPMTLGSVDDLRVGDEAIAAAGGGLDVAMVVSVVSKREFAGYWEYLLDEAVFTSPPHPRWSGAALMSRQGVLVAIGSLYVQDSLPGEQTRPGNMFVPVELLPPIFDELAASGHAARPPRPWLGMFGAEVEDRVVIAGLTDDGPADDAGLKVGDLVLGVAGEPVGGLSDFYRAVWALGPAGVEVPLDVYRDGELVHVAVHSADRRSFLKTPNRH
ncbi:MAG: S1C family serine protease [Alphaproteobacteria bacterium]|nr:S1C family serine protease [Alphaproteobacteria bacterium]